MSVHCARKRWMSSFKIGVLSDVHKKSHLQQEAIEVLKKEGVEFFIHAGDFSLQQNLQNLHQSGVRYCSVFGNNDHHLLQSANEFEIYKEPHYFKLHNTTFKLMHLPFYLSGDVDVVIFGHTHAYECEKKGNTLFLNPGELCGRNKPVSEYAMLEIKKNSYKVTYFFKDLNTDILEKKEFEYEK